MRPEDWWDTKLANPRTFEFFVENLGPADVRKRAQDLGVETVLDVGCGPGIDRAAWEAMGVEWRGVDASRLLVAKAGPRLCSALCAVLGLAHVVRSSTMAPNDAAPSKDEVTPAARSSPDRRRQRWTVGALVQPPARRVVGEHVERDRCAAAAGAHERDVPEVAVLPDGVESLRQQIVGIVGQVDDAILGWWCRRWCGWFGCCSLAHASPHVACAQR